MSIKRIKLFFLVCLVFILPITIVNIYIDPFWLLNHSNKFNNNQDPFNERQLKTTFLIYHNDKYDGILLGSSRVHRISSEIFKPLNIFNCSLSGMQPYEYNDYIKLVKSKNNGTLKYIFIGLDLEGIQHREIEHNNQQTIQTVTDFLYPIKILISLDTFKKALFNIKRSDGKINNFHYDRNLNGIQHEIKESDILKNMEYDIIPQKLDADFKSYFKLLDEIHNNNPNTKIILFTTPIYADFLAKSLQNPLVRESYKNWLKLLVKRYDKIYHFCFINDFTNNYRNFVDSHHLTSKAANELFKQNLNNEYVYILNKNNIDTYLKTITRDSFNEFLDTKQINKE